MLRRKFRKKGEKMSRETFQTVIKRQAEIFGDKVFMAVPASGEEMTYTGLEDQVKRRGELFLSYGLSGGEKLLLLMSNSPSFILNYFGCGYCGGTVIPVNTSLKEAELDYLIEDSQSKYIVVSDEFLENIPKKYREKSAELEDGTFLLILKEKICAGTDFPQVQAEDFAMILYTSGTTGHPKGVLLTYANLLAEAENIRRGHGLSADDVVLCVLPWFHINGLVITLITSILTGSRIVVTKKFSVSRFWGLVEKYKITWFSGVPTMYSHLLSKGKPETLDISSLRFARSASSSLPVAVLEAFEREYGVPIIESYGITEGCSQITTNPMPPAVRKAGSVGLPVGNRIKVADQDGTEQPPMREGEVLIQGDNVTCGYFRKPEETDRAFTDGWFHTGDMGYRDEDGYLFLTGRIKELINRAGEKFSPREVDEVLYQLPQVELAAAVGVPDDVYGEETAAFIKLKKGQRLTQEEVREYCKNHLAYYKVPKYVRFVEELPQGGNGKIQRLKLLELYKLS